MNTDPGSQPRNASAGIANSLAMAQEQLASSGIGDIARSLAMAQEQLPSMGGIARSLALAQEQLASSGIGNIARSLAMAQEQLASSGIGDIARSLAMAQEQLPSMGGIARSLALAQEQLASTGIGDIARSLAMAQEQLASSGIGNIARRLAMAQEQLPSMGGIANSLAMAREQLASTGIGDIARRLAMAREQLPSMGGITDLFEQLGSRVHWQSYDKHIAEFADLPMDATATTTNEENALFIWQEPGFGTLPVYEQINRLIDAVEKQQSPAWRKFLFIVLTIFLTAILNNAITFLRELYVPSRKPAEIIRELREVIRQVPAIKQEVKDYRIIGKQAVVARRSCKPKAAIKAELEPGRIVRLVEKQSQWCLVEWYDRDGLAEQGWVKSKYLKKLD